VLVIEALPLLRTLHIPGGDDVIDMLLRHNSGLLDHVEEARHHRVPPDLDSRSKLVARDGLPHTYSIATRNLRQHKGSQWSLLCW
jgi:hypothetical protein